MNDFEAWQRRNRRDALVNRSITLISILFMTLLLWVLFGYVVWALVGLIFPA